MRELEKLSDHASSPSSDHDDEKPPKSVLSLSEYPWPGVKIFVVHVTFNEEKNNSPMGAKTLESSLEKELHTVFEV